MEAMARQIRILQIAVLVLGAVTVLLGVNLFRPLLGKQRFRVVEAQKVNIREADGTLKAALSDSAGFNEFQRAESGKGVKFSGLMFYNQEGEEEGGLVYSGKAAPGGQDSDVTLTMDQYKQDQNVYLHHEEHKDAAGSRIEDGLSVNSRPDWKRVDEEYRVYSELEKLSGEQADAAKLKALQDGKISANRLFLGVRRGVKENVPYDDAGIFIKNKWGRAVIKLYVDNDNKPHFEVSDRFGKATLYELKLAAEK
jgi:hypothetical protein